jgi:hypothetical protein
MLFISKFTATLEVELIQESVLIQHRHFNFYLLSKKQETYYVILLYVVYIGMLVERFSFSHLTITT